MKWDWPLTEVRQQETHPSTGDKEVVPTRSITRWMGSIGGMRRRSSVTGNIARKVYNHVPYHSK